MKTVDHVLGQYHYVDVPTRELIAQEAARYAPGNEEMFIRAFASLQKAMMIGDAIFCNQYDRASFDAVIVLGEMRRLGASAFNRFLDATQIAGSCYDPFTRERIEPDFTREDLREGYALLVAEESPLVDAEVSGGEINLSALESLLFDSRVSPTLPKTRGFYPVGINDSELEALLARIRADDALKSHYTVVDMMSDGTLTAIPFTELYATEIGAMGNFIDSAIEGFEKLAVVAQAEKAEGLRAFITYLREQNRANSTLDSELVYSSTDRIRVRAYKVAAPVPFFLALSFESLYDDPFKLKMAQSGTLGLETEACRDLGQFVAKFGDIASLERNIPYTPAIRDSPPSVPVLMQDVIYRSGHAFIGAQGIAVTYLSEDNAVNNEEGVVIACWRNVLETKGKVILAPIAHTVLPLDVIAKYGDTTAFDTYLAMAFAVGVMSHEQRHFIGAQKDQKELQEALGDIFNDISEGAAEIGRVYSFRELAQEGYGSLDAQLLEEFLYDSYFADMFRHMRFAADNPYRKSAETRLNYFVQSGAVEVGDDIRVVDYSKLKEATATLYELHLELLHTADGAKARAFADQYKIAEDSVLGQKKQALVDKINRKGIPRDIVMRYAV